MTELRRNCARHPFLLPPLLLSLAALAAARPAPAQETRASGEEKLDEIVVTATRLGERVRDLARSVSIVDRERIQNGTQQLGLDEALSAVPGLYIQNRYNFAQDLRISLRGFGARSGFGVRGVKLVVDGIPETLPDGQAQVDSVDLGSARRIEVLRGPASALYGNAAGGVIAIESELGQTPSSVEASLAAGELGFSRYGVKAVGSADTFDYLLNLSHQEFDGYREHAAARGSLLNAKLGLPLGGADRLTATLNLSDQPKAQDAGGINAAQAAAAPRSARDANLQFDAGEALDQQRLGLVYERRRDAGTLTLRNYVTWRDFANKLPFNSGGIVEFDRFVYGVGAQFQFGDALPERWQLVVGADVDRQDDDRRRFDNEDGVYGGLTFEQRERVAANAIYLQSEFAVDERWTLTGGLRYDEIEFDVDDRFAGDGDDSGLVDFDQLSPSLGLTLDAGGRILFASWSSSFETPTTTELANPDASGGFNQALEPQRADNFELGFKTGSERLYFEAAAFVIDVEDELVPFELAQFPGRTFFVNAGRSDRRGIETAVAWQSGNGLSVEASWTWSDFSYDEFIDEDGNDFAGRRLPGLPEHFGYLGLTYRHASGVTALAEAVHSGKLYADDANATEVDAYTVTNLRIYGDFERGRWSVRPHLGINNLFDERYNSNIRINAFGARYFEPAPGRNVYAGITVGLRQAD